jgi:predicted ATPase
MLLSVLDNCEHLVDAVTKLTDMLLRAAAGRQAAATSRESLTIDAGTVTPVAPPEPGRQLTAAEPMRFPAVCLFAQRAGQVVPGGGTCCRV